ncbi:4-hydroxy-tetrahydrodipicolinate synthase [Marinococcus halophilus]|uniref:4-hydroxy-tetrahydrodipicolinate synthase n=1 Tax=Marinococcus halophilus TaxID=1371 RepID=A0A510Y4W7_MARHA|nr:4-hydroxy-tetrahydrodipicolinate synthase [Marinococcus halophilus]OZT80779.1 4-hydroxy-tetrahydrodipicolinate synthase [Marinococcus halophilus]GEK57831.1 4-hydroxy-tetrahydrodipicolinate synthase [Marinococcus halophilus]
MNFGRLSTAMVTPFDEHGDIDYTALTKLINHLISTGTESIVVAGTTGESPTLSHEEKISLFRHTVQTVNGRVPVIAGTGSNDTRASLALSLEAEKTGIDAVMLVTPYYNKPSQEGMYQHFRTIAEGINTPVMLYNIPGRSAAGMTPETIVRLSHVKNICSIKEASGDLEAAAYILQHAPQDFTLYSGDDSLTLPLLSVGATGVVSVSAHVAGESMQDMIQSFFNGQPVYAASRHRDLLPLMKSMFAAPSPTPVKAALEMRGIISGDVRLPMVRLNAEEEAQLRQVVAPAASFYVG